MSPTLRPIMANSPYLIIIALLAVVPAVVTNLYHIQVMIFSIIQRINQKQGVSILLVEQNANMALSIAGRGYVLQTGEIVLSDTAQNLLNNPLMQKAYLGVE